MTNKERYEANKERNDKRNAALREKTKRVNENLKRLEQANKGTVIPKDSPLAPTYELEVIPDKKPIYEPKDYTPRRRITHG